MIRVCLAAIVLLGLSAPASAQTPPEEAPAATAAEFPVVTVGVLTYLQYSAQLKEDADGFNAFDVTRGYVNIRAQLTDRVRVRFTPALRPLTDASLVETRAFGVEYAYLEVDVADGSAVAFGLHSTPWLDFEQGINRYRVQGPLFVERQGLIPGPSDVGASFRHSSEFLEVHAGVYNGEGPAQAEFGEHKSVQGRVTVRPFSDGDLGTSVGVSGFYSHGWHATDRPRNVAIVMGSFESPQVVATGQYVFATENPFVAQDLNRRGLSFFGEVRQGPTGWAGLGRVDIFDPDTSDEGDKRRRLIFGGAYWSQWGRGRLGVVITLDQVYRDAESDALVDNRLLAQTHIEF